MKYISILLVAMTVQVHSQVPPACKNPNTLILNKNEYGEHGCAILVCLQHSKKGFNASNEEWTLDGFEPEYSEPCVEIRKLFNEDVKLKKKEKEIEAKNIKDRQNKEDLYYIKSQLK